MILKAEKECRNVKILAVIANYGNSELINSIKNTYHILAELNRTDVSQSNYNFFFLLLNTQRLKFYVFPVLYFIHVVPFYTYDALDKNRFKYIYTHTHTRRV